MGNTNTPVKLYPSIMISGTYADIIAHRKALAIIIEQFDLKPEWMERKTPKSDHDVIDASLQMVKDASAFIGIISRRCGQVLECPKRNPNGYSVSRLEFEEARRLGKPMFIFIMDEAHKMEDEYIETDHQKKQKLAEFKTTAKQGRIYYQFNSLEEFKSEAPPRVAQLKSEITETTPPPNTNSSIKQTSQGDKSPNVNNYSKGAVFIILALVCCVVFYILNNDGKQKTEGDKSPNINTDSGNININYGTNTTSNNGNVIKNNKQVITGNVGGDVTQTVNNYLQDNAQLKKLKDKIQTLDNKLAKKAISNDLKEHLTHERVELKQALKEQTKTIEAAYYEVLKWNFTDEDLKELQQLFLEGEHQQIADRIKPKEIEQRINLRKTENENDANKLLILAKSTALQFNDKDRLNKTIALYDLSLKANRNRYNLFAYASFLQEHKQYNKATPIYQEVLSIYRKLAEKNPSVFLPYLATTLNDLGLLQRAIKELELAEVNYNEALTIRRKLAQQNPSVFLPDVATTLNNLGVLQRAKKELDLAEASYKEALAIRRKLAEQNPSVFLPDVAATLNNLANLKKAKKKFVEAELNFQEALGIYRKLAKQNPDAFLLNVAGILNNWGLVQWVKSELELAEANYQEALGIYRKLAEKNPSAFLPNVAATLNNLANLQRVKNELHNAEASYNEALAIRRKLAEKNPSAFLPDVATTLNNLANLQSNKNELDNAKTSYNEALAIYKKLAEKNPSAFLPDVAGILNNLAVLQMDKNELVNAEASYNEALGIYRKLAEKNPSAFLPDVAMTLNNLANLQRAKNELELAEANYKEALGIRRKLAELNPAAFLPNVAGILNNLGLLQKVKNELVNAEASYNEALSIRRKLAEQNPSAFLPDVAMTLINMSIFYQSSKVDKALSLQLADEAITILLPFWEIPRVQNYLKGAIQVLKDWDIDVEAYLKEKLGE